MIIEPIVVVTESVVEFTIKFPTAVMFAPTVKLFTTLAPPEMITAALFNAIESVRLDTSKLFPTWTSVFKIHDLVTDNPPAITIAPVPKLVASVVLLTTIPPLVEIDPARLKFDWICTDPTNVVLPATWIPPANKAQIVLVFVTATDPATTTFPERLLVPRTAKLLPIVAPPVTCKAPALLEVTSVVFVT